MPLAAYELAPARTSLELTTWSRHFLMETEAAWEVDGGGGNTT